MNNNPLLEALKNGTVFEYCLNHNSTEFEAHILDILEKQRQVSADNASVDKQSILNAKLI